MTRKPTFAQIEIARMRSRRRQERMTEARRVAELRSEKERADRAEAQAIKYVNNPLIKEALLSLNLGLGDQLKTIVANQLARMEIETYEQPMTEGMIKVFHLRIPELHMKHAISGEELKRVRKYERI